ncbi:MAG: ATP-binding cassette domain-containing protein [Elusimicrobia bacterium]|nr:ATP-binding cassette domain-containing protein [Elusimicrobiota bacterium]
MAELLEIDVSIERGRRALRLRLSSSARLILVRGPSGAGKTTLLRVIAGLEPQASGRVHFDGVSWQDSVAFAPPWRRRAAWVPQDSLLFPHLTMRENLAFGGASGDAVDRVAASLELAPLLDRPPALLSGGERQRVALARALLSRPRLLLLDEPFAALDDSLRERIRSFVRGWVEENGVPAVLVSHDREDAVIAAERWTIADGQLSRTT